MTSTCIYTRKLNKLCGSQGSREVLNNLSERKQTPPGTTQGTDNRGAMWSMECVSGWIGLSAQRCQEPRRGFGGRVPGPLANDEA